MNNNSTTGWVVYIVRCHDDSLYTGITNNLARRLKDHNQGRGGKYTAAHYPVKLVYTETQPDRSSALKREALIKSWNRKKKDCLILAGKPRTNWT